MATGTINVQSLAVVQESSFGSLVNNFPDTTIFATGFKSIPILRGNLGTVGEIQMNEDGSVRPGFFSRAPDVATVHDSNGNRVQRRTGELTFTIDAVRTFGAETDSDEHWMTWLLASSAIDGGKVDVGTESAVSGSDVSDVTVADDTGYDVGQLLATKIVGERGEYTAIVAKPGDDELTLSPELSAALDEDTLYQLRTFGYRNSEVGDSLAFRIDGDKWRTYAFGCRLSAANFSLNNKRLQVEMTFVCAFIYDTHEAVTAGSNWLLTQDNIAEPALHSLNAEFVVSDPIDPTDAGYPAIAGRNSLGMDNITINITRELTPCVSTNSVLGMSELVASNLTVEISGTLCTITTEFNRDYLDKTYRQVMVGFGPVGEGRGMAFFMPAGHLTADPSLRDIGGPLVKQTLTWTQGQWAGDVGNPGPTNLIDTSFRIGIVDAGVA